MKALITGYIPYGKHHTPFALQPRRLAVVFLTAAFLHITAVVSGQDSLLVQANRSYADGQYEQAIEGYNAILNSNLESAEVYYNLGNAYYKTGQYTRSILAYERAKLLAPNDDDIRFNLELANQHIVDAINPLPKVFFLRWWDALSNESNADGWARNSLVAFFLALSGFGLFFISSSATVKRTSFWIAVILLCTTVFCFNFAARQKKHMTEQRFAIIVQPSVTVKSSPSEGGTDLFLIHEGLKVEIKDKLGSWTEIRLADGNQGWLPDSSLEKI